MMPRGRSTSKAPRSARSLPLASKSTSNWPLSAAKAARPSGSSATLMASSAPIFRALPRMRPDIGRHDVRGAGAPGRDDDQRTDRAPAGHQNLLPQQRPGALHAVQRHRERLGHRVLAVAQVALSGDAAHVYSKQRAAGKLVVQTSWASP
jgi:hypothetical protein